MTKTSKINRLVVAGTIKQYAKKGIVVGAKVKHTFYYYGERGESSKPIASHHTGTVKKIDPKTGFIEIKCKEAPGHYRTYLHLIGKPYGVTVEPTGLMTKTDNWRKPISKIVLVEDKVNPMLRGKKK